VFRSREWRRQDIDALPNWVWGGSVRRLMTANSAESTRNNIHGIIALLGAQVLLVGSDTFIKLASASIPPTQIMAYRGPISIAVMLAVVWLSGSMSRIGGALKPRVMFRGGLEAVIALLFITALGGLALGDITAILQATPLILTAMSICILGQRAGVFEWIVVVLGFAGVLMIVQPGANTGAWLAALAFLTAVMIAFRDIVTRSLDPGIPSSVVALATTVAVCALGWAGAPFQEWKPMTATLWFYVFGTALLVAAANLLMVRAFRGVDIAVVSPFRYAVVVWAMAVGYWVWGDRPNVLALFGVALIVLCGIALMRREYKKSRRPELEAEGAVG
jgi:drug/metabolite transporter (DMT)-like permease